MNPNPNFLVQISSGGVGVGAKKFGMSFETQGKQTFWRDILGFWRDIPWVPQKFEKNKFVFIFWALLQNEASPEKCLNRCENWFENREKGTEK